MHRQFKRILDLVRRTGDRMIVTDPDGREAYVVMGLDQYEELLDGEGGFEDGWEPDWAPEDYGELVDLGNREAEPSGQAPENLQKEVEKDLAILDALQEEKKSEDKPKDNPDEDRFYLEPIE